MDLKDPSWKLLLEEIVYRYILYVMFQSFLVFIRGLCIYFAYTHYHTNFVSKQRQFVSKNVHNYTVVVVS